MLYVTIIIDIVHNCYLPTRLYSISIRRLTRYPDSTDEAQSNMTLLCVTVKHVLYAMCQISIEIKKKNSLIITYKFRNFVNKL